jgi:hypothetical protein
VAGEPGIPRELDKVIASRIRGLLRSVWCFLRDPHSKEKESAGPLRIGSGL